MRCRSNRSEGNQRRSAGRAGAAWGSPSAAYGGAVLSALLLAFVAGPSGLGSPAAAQEGGDSEEESSEAADANVDPGERVGGSEQSSGDDGERSESEGTGGEGADEEGAETAENGEDSARGESDEELGLPAPEEADEEFRAELQEFRRVYDRYSGEVRDYQETVDSIVDAKYQEKKAEITKQYDQRSSQLEAVERERREDAIERFKEFLRRHPDRPVYTPDAMYRLAELYFERANDRYLQADERYQKEMERYQKGRRPSPPESPRKDYSETIETFSKLVRDWPDYRLLDGAYYLLAYCHQEMGNSRKARDLFSELIVKRPESEFVPEAWLRIGEYHFDRSDDPGEIELARYAYRQSMKYEESKFFDKALYKLAWANYRLDDFDQAIENFERLVEWRDETGDKSGSVLRREAIKYVAISLAEEDWDLDGSVDEGFVMPRVEEYLGEGKPYERKVLEQLVGYLFENTRHERAAKVVRYTLDEYPNHPDNPKLHEELIKALMRPPQKLEEAFEERRRLIDLYGPESDWYAYQKKQGNEEAVDYGQQLIRDNLIQAATWYHEKAQELKDKARAQQDEELLAEARKRYRKAARGYKSFLERYPDDKDVYRWNFFYADSLYYAGDYEQAYQQYRVVRELDLEDNKFQADAAFNAVKALEFLIKEKVDEGELPESIVPESGREEARQAAQQQDQGSGGAADEGGEERTDQQKPELAEKKIPEIVERYITAMDRYVVLRLNYDDRPELAAKFAFNAGKIYYDYNQYDTARERFSWIVENYPEREEAYLAGSLILETYRQEKKYDKLATWADKLSGVLKGDQAKQVKEEVREFKLGALFKSAEKLFEQEKYEKAAQEYRRLVDKEPEHENAPRALNNAAVAYEELKKYESALELYERMVRDYPESPLAGYALYRVAVNSERFFEFDDAATSYMKFYVAFSDRDTPGDAETLGFDVRSDESYMTFYEESGGEAPEELENMNFVVEDKLPKALLSAGVLSNSLQEYERAGTLFERFVERYPNHEQAADVQWQAVEAWKKAGDDRAMIDAIDFYKQEYPDNDARVLEGMMRVAQHHEDQGREEQAGDQYRAIIDRFENREMEKGSDAAFFAAKAQFRLAERKFEEWKEIRLKGSLEQQKEQLEEKIEKQKEVANAFKQVWTYKNLEYTLASGYRVGSLFEEFAVTLYEAPCPGEPGTKKNMMCRRMFEKEARPLEEQALARWSKTMEKAREAKIVNEWTKKTLKGLNKYKPDEYPLYKESRTAASRRAQTGRSMLRTVPETKGGGFDKESDSGSGESPTGGEDEE